MSGINFYLRQALSTAAGKEAINEVFKDFPEMSKALKESLKKHKGIVRKMAEKDSEKYSPYTTDFIDDDDDEQA